MSGRRVLISLRCKWHRLTAAHANHASIFFLMQLCHLGERLGLMFRRWSSKRVLISLGGDGSAFYRRF